MEKTRALDIDRDCAQLGELSVRIHNHPSTQVVRVQCHGEKYKLLRFKKILFMHRENVFWATNYFHMRPGCPDPQLDAVVAAAE